MHRKAQSKAAQNSTASHTPGFDASSSSSAHSSSPDSKNEFTTTMPPNINFSYPNSSGSSTPVSTRSSISYVSWSSTPGQQPKRLSMKSSLKSSTSVGSHLNRRSSPATVRFVEMEPMPRMPTRAPPMLPTRPQPDATGDKVPNPLLQYQHHHTISGPSSATIASRYRHSAKAYYAAPSRPSAPLTVPKRRSVQAMHSRSSTYNHTPLSSPTSTPTSDLRWSSIPLPTDYWPPALDLGSRVASYQSTVSNISVQSAPAVLSTSPDTATPPGQYNALQNYVPCLYPACSMHYTSAHAGPTYHLPQGPYAIARLHGHCPCHASKELKEANALCKREWESLRQNAGRKTLGLIAAEFEAFLEQFRNERRREDMKLRQSQTTCVLGAVTQSSEKQRSSKGNASQANEWDWRYTPRPCTRAGCHNAYYSPYANHLFTYYTTPRPSTFKPMHTLCPSCAKDDVETFEQSVGEKWSSRCGWDDEEWNEWFTNAQKDREMELEFWTKVQERAVVEKGPARLVERKEESEGGVEKAVGKKGRRSVFRKLFGSMTA